MKIACSMAVSVLFCTGTMTAANASVFPDTGDKALASQVQSEHADESQKTAQPPTRAQLRAAQRQREAAAYDKNWLMRGYEHQLQLNSSQSKDDGSNLYYQLSSDKDLARLANVASIDDESSASFRTGDTTSGKTAVSLRSDLSTSDLSTSRSASQSDLFKPLISPLSPSVASSLNNFYSSDAIASSAPSSFLAPDKSSAPVKKTQSPNTDPNRDSASIDTPGMTAAEKNPLMDKNDLMLDALPTESSSDNHARMDSMLPQQLPLTSNLERLNKQQDAAMAVPGTKKALPLTPTATVTPANSLLLNGSPNDPVPDKTPPPSPVRAPIADPFDIFYR